MTKQEIKTNNEIIGRFMSKAFPMSTIHDHKTLTDYHHSKMKYHKSWNELIPVIKLFESIKLRGLNEKKKDHWQNHIFNIAHESANWDIENTYKAVFLAVKWTIENKIKNYNK